MSPAKKTQNGKKAMNRVLNSKASATNVFKADSKTKLPANVGKKTKN